MKEDLTVVSTCLAEFDDRKRNSNSAYEQDKLRWWNDNGKILRYWFRHPAVGAEMNNND